MIKFNPDFDNQDMSETGIETLNSWLSTAGKTLKLDLVLNAERQCAVQVDGEMVCVLQLTEDQKGVLFYAIVALVPSDTFTSHSLFSKVLSLNLFQLETRGGALGLSPNKQHIVYSFFEPIANLTEEIFVKTLFNFIQVASGLHKDFKQSATETAPQSYQGA